MPIAAIATIAAMRSASGSLSLRNSRVAKNVRNEPHATPTAPRAYSELQTPLEVWRVVGDR